MTTFRVLIVCHGNTCRSPMAEAVLRQTLAERILTGTVEIVSAGVAVSNLGGSADPRAIRAAREHGVDISRHQTRQLTGTDASAADLVVAMDDATAAGVRSIAGQSVSDASGDVKVHLLMSFAGDSSLPAQIGDPYLLGTPEAYGRALDLITMACAGLAEAIAARLSASGARPTC